MTPLEARIAEVAGARVLGLRPLSGGCVGGVFRADLASGVRVVVKAGEAGSRLDIEGDMLGALARAGLPVPAVIFAADALLVMEYIETSGGLTEGAEEHAAELLAKLHENTAPAHGLGRDTLIGGLTQPNGWNRSWLAFFRDRRILYMAGEAHRAGRLPARMVGRVEKLAARLGEWIAEPLRPSLVHGDAWGGNILCRDGRVAAFIDPAVYYADPEIELAFGTLFGTFGRAFFRRYGEIRALRDGFFEARRDLYNLYPLLVHARLFGGTYVGDVERTLTRFGC
ncbi:MAG: fructosamine kinase [Rhodospirillales bacterium]|nr:fructosamine kinase [Rhodospirillales bacterium]MSP80081.1 fructosamine kinase [Rhodospirillales bacterium]